MIPFSDEDRVESLLEYMGSNSEDIFDSESRESVHYVDADGAGEAALIVEQQCVVEKLQLSKADMLLLWAAAYPVFNQRVPKKTSKIALSFLTEHILGRKGAGPIPNRALNRIERLKKLVR